VVVVAAGAGGGGAAGSAGRGPEAERDAVGENRRGGTGGGGADGPDEEPLPQKSSTTHKVPLLGTTPTPTWLT
jgi:hypothetical protein